MLGAEKGKIIFGSVGDIPPHFKRYRIEFVSLKIG
jgi:hypothetical protein